MSYRKREVAHWNEGKRYKGTRKARERAYAENDIVTQIASEDEKFRYKHYSRKPNKEAQLKHRVEWYERVLAECTREPKSWNCSFANYARDNLRKYKKQLKELQEESNAGSLRS